MENTIVSGVDTLEQCLENEIVSYTEWNLEFVETTCVVGNIDDFSMETDSTTHLDWYFKTTLLLNLPDHNRRKRMLFVNSSPPNGTGFGLT
jgi:hypothetical protein